MSTESMSVTATRAGPLVGPGWSIASLASPAYVRAGSRWLPGSHRLWLDWCVHAVEEAIHAAFGLRPTISPVRAAPIISNGSVPQFGIVLELSRPGESERTPLTVLLRPDATRALADAVLLDTAGLRGHGNPTNVELGILEFAALVVTDSITRRLAEQCGLSAPAISITEFLSAADVQARFKGSATSAVALAVWLASRQGEAIVIYDGWSVSPAESSTHFRAGTDTDPPITAGVALPPIRLTPDELRTAAPGDCLLLGISEIDARVSGAALVATTGWELCPAIFMHDSPTSVGVRCQALAPKPRDGWVSEEDAPQLTPVLGETKIQSLTLRSWEVDRVQDFPKSAWSVRLWHNGEVWGSGELVRVGAEIAVRLDHLSAAGDPP